MKKTKIIVIVLVAVIGLAIVGVGVVRHLMLSGVIREEKTDIVKVIKEEHNVKTVIYGDKVAFDKRYSEFDYTHIKTLKSNEWKSNADHAYLIINDLSGKTKLSQKKLMAIKKYADMNTNFSFFYVGKSKKKLFAAVFTDLDVNEEDMSIGYIMYQGSRILSVGDLWDQECYKYVDVNPYQLGDAIIFTINSDIRSE